MPVGIYRLAIGEEESARTVDLIALDLEVPAVLLNASMRFRCQMVIQVGRDDSSQNSKLGPHMCRCSQTPPADGVPVGAVWRPCRCE
jgi:hypothetical protein